MRLIFLEFLESDVFVKRVKVLGEEEVNSPQSSLGAPTGASSVRIVCRITHYLSLST